MPRICSLLLTCQCAQALGSKTETRWLPGSPFEGLPYFSSPNQPSSSDAAAAAFLMTLPAGQPQAPPASFLQSQPQLEQFLGSNLQAGAATPAWQSQAPAASFLQSQPQLQQFPGNDLQLASLLQSQPQLQQFLGNNLQASEAPEALLQESTGMAGDAMNSVRNLQLMVTSLQGQLKAERDQEQRISSEAGKAVADEKAGLAGVSQAVEKVIGLAQVRAAQQQQQLERATSELLQARSVEAAAEQQAHAAEEQLERLNVTTRELIRENASLQEQVLGPLQARAEVAEKSVALAQTEKAALEEQLQKVKVQVEQANVSRQAQRHDLGSLIEQEVAKAKADAEVQVQSARAEAEAEVSRARSLAQQAVQQTRDQLAAEVQRAQASEAAAKQAAAVVQQDAASRVSLAQQEVSNEVQSARDSVARVEGLMQGWATPDAAAMGADLTGTTAVRSPVPLS